MSTKMPIYIKRGSHRGKKEKLRDILSSDMISPPLGDFRHTIHIGNGDGENDLFGDLSFLQGKFHLLPSLHGERSHLSRPTSVCGGPHCPKGSLLLKNAISLPSIGSVQSLTQPASIPTQTRSQIPPPKPPRLHLDKKNMTIPLSRQDPSPHPVQVSNKTLPGSSFARCSPGAERSDPEDRAQEKPYLSHASSLLSLHLDLGPSILDDVLQIMDNQHLSHSGVGVHGGRQEIFSSQT